MGTVSGLWETVEIFTSHMSPQSIITEVIPNDIQTSHKWVIPGHTTYLTESLNATMLGLWSSLVTWRHGGHWDHFTDDFSMLFIFYGNLICCSSNSNELIPTNFCTWHDSSAVMSCAKICRDMITKNGITVKRIVSEKDLCQASQSLPWPSCFKVTAASLWCWTNETL